MSLDFGAHPGLLYVVATLLPLASFVLILLARGLRQAVKPYRDSGLGGLYQLLGGDHEHRGAAYVATGAIALSFVCSLIGFVLFIGDHAEHGQVAEPAAQEAKEGEGHAATGHEATDDRWQGQIVRARIGGKPIDASELASEKPAAAAEPPAKLGTVLTLGYHIDHLTVAMFLMVTFIATLIHIFSIGYMSEELQEEVVDHQVHTDHGHLHRPGRFGRFFLFLSLFCFSMLNLVLADNLFQVFVSWELVGICSYLLIGFYFERHSASTAANKAFITNRIGDAGFIIGLLVIWTYVGTFNFDDLFARIRAPHRDSHNELIETRGQFIRADIKEEKPDYKTLMLAPGDGSEVVLFPPEMAKVHLHAEDLAPFQVDDADKSKQTPTELEVAHRLQSNKLSSMPYWLLVVAGLGVFLGCVGKSAQFPLHVWLPDAMEGPTPVSALIHAATMVAAGVYLVGRCYPLFTPEARLVIAYTGAITLFVAATIAIVMTDIKKVLAYSTVSQLGYMMLALGVGGWVAGLFHLITHAFFKALLFLCSGSVIYGCHHEQEMTKMGGLYSKMKITAITMLVGVLAIAGIPLFSGWYSKDAILAQAFGFAKQYPSHILLFILPLVTAGITTFYMFRMWFMTFTGKPRDEHVYEHAHESPPTMTMPLIGLAIFSVVVAWGWPVWDAEASALEQHMHHAMPRSVLADFGGPLNELEMEKWGGAVLAETESARLYAMQAHALVGLIATGLVLIAILFAAVVYYWRRLDPDEAREQFPAVHRFLSNKWYFDELYSVLLVRPALIVANWCRAFDSRVLDGEQTVERRPVYVGVVNWVGRFWAWIATIGGLIDHYIVDGLVNLTADVIYAVGARLRRVQTGYIRSYVLFLVLGAVAIFLALSYLVRIAMAG
jgi:NADH-quinone oxidoreductase subunit L